RILPDGGYKPGIVRAVVLSYYNATLKHYFVTADVQEQRLLDDGYFDGWERMSEHWTVVAAGSGRADFSPVCRFYGRSEAGLDSHLYSALPTECADVERQFPASWVKESDNVYEVYLPDPLTGACP